MKRIILTLPMAVTCGAATAANIPWRVPNYSLTARAMNIGEALDTFGVAGGISVVRREAVRGAYSQTRSNGIKYIGS